MMPPESLTSFTAALSTASEFTPKDRNGPDLAPQPAMRTVSSAKAGETMADRAAAATAGFRMRFRLVIVTPLSISVVGAEPSFGLALRRENRWPRPLPAACLSRLPGVPCCRHLLDSSGLAPRDWNQILAKQHPRIRRFPPTRGVHACFRARDVTAFRRSVHDRVQAPFWLARVQRHWSCPSAELTLDDFHV